MWMPGSPEPDAKEREKLGFLEKTILSNVESVLASQGLTKDVLQKWVMVGKRALNDVKVSIYGGKLADGRQVHGYAHLEAHLFDRIDQLEAALQGAGSMPEGTPRMVPGNPPEARPAGTDAQEDEISRYTLEVVPEDLDDHVDDEAGTTTQPDKED